MSAFGDFEVKSYRLGPDSPPDWQLPAKPLKSHDYFPMHSIELSLQAAPK